MKGVGIGHMGWAATWPSPPALPILPPDRRYLDRLTCGPTARCARRTRYFPGPYPYTPLNSYVVRAVGYYPALVMMHGLTVVLVRH